MTIPSGVLDFASLRGPQNKQGKTQGEVKRKPGLRY